ncbi:hypothetical protein Nepgr_023254 [Nepenthes gracilis]|uniref:Uncharacterized protein n=1 Tax=Nepenthes gracilis TaxID=150966 RepID=A0AAD3T287_NEPGR|nr:hypothetical protein Nepgr_023254 [Nepenthes gracilis]
MLWPEVPLCPLAFEAFPPLPSAFKPPILAPCKKFGHGIDQCKPKIVRLTDRIFEAIPASVDQTISNRTLATSRQRSSLRAPPQPLEGPDIASNEDLKKIASSEIPNPPVSSSNSFAILLVAFSSDTLEGDEDYELKPKHLRFSLLDIQFVDSRRVHVVDPPDAPREMQAEEAEADEDDFQDPTINALKMLLEDEFNGMVNGSLGRYGELPGLLQIPGMAFRPIFSFL